jgi:Domain of unknown function (DUF4386)
MESPKKTARIAGALYLVVVLTGMFALLYVPSKLIVWTDATATFNNIKNSETLFRLGIYAGILCYTAFLLLPLVLYTLFQHINKTHAIAMVALALTSVPISLFNLTHKLAVLTLISKPDLFSATDLPKQVLLQLEYYNNGIDVAAVFWGLWLFPFGYLVFKSGMLPKVLGILLMAGCFGYIINITGGLLIPGYSELGISGYISLPSALGEIGTCLWLLIAGVKVKDKNQLN